MEAGICLKEVNIVLVCVAVVLGFVVTSPSLPRRRSSSGGVVRVSVVVIFRAKGDPLLAGLALETGVLASHVDLGGVEVDDVALLVRHSGLLNRGAFRSAGGGTRGGTDLPCLDVCERLGLRSIVRDHFGLSCEVPSVHTRADLLVLEAGLPSASAATERTARKESCILYVYVCEVV